jgi:tripartite-type tricarboxylate transporter receptor subunit TctC
MIRWNRNLFLKETTMVVANRVMGAAVIALTAAASLPASAQTPEQFYKGKTVTLMLGHPPGGSYHMYATLAANHIKKHIPGNPNVIIEHRPGGGGVVAVRHFYSNAPRDGSVMGLFPETIANVQLFQPKIGQWNVAEMNYIGSFSGVGAVMIRRHDAPAKTIAEMRKIESSTGCTGKTSQAYQTSALMKNLGGFKLKIICGYPGSADYVLALQRGELDMVSSAWVQWRTSHTETIAKGDMVPVFQTGLRRNAEIKDVPLMQDLVDDPVSKKIIDFISADTAIGRALITTQQVPADRLAALRAAFDKLLQDPAFLKDAERAKAQIDATPGVEVQKVVESILSTPKDLIEKSMVAME